MGRLLKCKRHNFVWVKILFQKFLSNKKNGDIIKLKREIIGKIN